MKVELAQLAGRDNDTAYRLVWCTCLKRKWLVLLAAFFLRVFACHGEGH